jgi:hypothetical protein
MGKKYQDYIAKVDFEKLVKEIKKEFEFRNYEVEITNREEFPKHHCRIILKKTNKFRKIVGISKRVDITIEGKPGDFKVCVIFQDTRRNLLANTATTSPIHVATFGFSLPFTLVPLLYNEIKFEDYVLNFINKIIDDFNR